MENFSLWDVFVSMFWFMLLFAWIWMVIAILSDIFRDTTMSGWGKAAWTLMIIVFPWLGSLIYLIARGGSMNQRAIEQAQRQEAQLREYVQDVASPTSTADELAKLADLRERGVLSVEEYDQAKASVLGQVPGATVTPRQPV
jgi:uncharacterized membrane protein YcjF (UPF0283 family)